MLGALPYVGLTVVSPFAGRIFGKWRAKNVILVSIALNSVATLLMVLTVFLPRETLGVQPGSEDLPSSDFTSASTAAAVASEAAAVASSLGNPPIEQTAGGPQPFFRLPDFSFIDMTPSAILLLTSRLLIGFTQAPFVIYAPVWVDEFAPPRKAALWMGLMQGSAVVGVTVSPTAFFSQEARENKSSIERIYTDTQTKERWGVAVQTAVCRFSGCASA